MKRVLLIAFHFPPLAGSSGIQRTLRFAQELPAFGWEPVVLSAHPRAYEQVSDDLLAEVPPSTVVRRAQAFDAARHLSLLGRYPGFAARPDRWMTWQYDAVRCGAAMVKDLKEVFLRLWDTPGLRCVLLRAEGKNFSFGGDLKSGPEFARFGLHC